MQKDLAVVLVCSKEKWTKEPVSAHVAWVRDGNQEQSFVYAAWAKKRVARDVMVRAFYSWGLP
jgi:hypothetical protein